MNYKAIHGNLEITAGFLIHRELWNYPTDAVNSKGEFKETGKINGMITGFFALFFILQNLYSFIALKIYAFK